ncbi:MAG: class I SAM-dependent methyltransferase [Chitinispirillaceae bacterium]
MDNVLNQAQIEECKSRFNLTYHVSYAAMCRKMAGFAGKDVLEVGGSLPPEFVFDYLKVRTWTAMETPEYDQALKETGGITHKGTILGNEGMDYVPGADTIIKENYRFIYGNIEELSERLYEQFDLIFSIATFEHIHKMPMALEQMYNALKADGKVFSMFSPVWSSFDGHHLPKITDIDGKSYNFGNSPIPAWGHLLMGPAEMYEYLCTKTDKVTAAHMAYYVYNSTHINRFFVEDYIRFFSLSPFTVETCNLTFPASMPPGVQKRLQELFPGKKHFAYNGILVILKK